MTTDELVREINNCSSYKALRVPFLNSIKIFTSDDFTLMTFENSTKYLSDIDIQFDSLKRTVNSRCSDLGNFYALLDLINEFVNTPLNKREPEKEYYLVANRDSLKRYGTNAMKYVNCICNGSDKFSFEYGEPAKFSERELDNIKKLYPFIAPAIDAMKEETKDDD